MGQADDQRLLEALDEWHRALGPGNVLREGAVLRAAETATFATSQRVLAILRPGSRSEVQQTVRIANARGVALYPVSTGKNWGYGSRVPAADCALLDLGRLNRILEYDEKLAYVTLEPGVTQRQLFAYLADRGSRLWMDATGASPDCSIIGNTLERGFGHTPMGDHCGNVCGLEVVLPDGEVVDTGFGRFDNARTRALSRWGVGPSLDGLFSQSNLGIVTRMSVWLMPAPECFQAFFFTTSRPDGLAAVIEALRPLRLNGTLRSVAHIGNDYKVLTATSQYPWNETAGVTPLGPERMAAIRAALGVGCWNGSGGLYGTRAQVREGRRLLRRALGGSVDRLQFVDDRLIAVMARFAGPFRLVTGWDIRRTLAVLRPVYGLLKGVPTDDTLGSAYWRKRSPPPPDPDPDRDGCGLLWSSPVLPNTGEAAAEVAELTSRVLLSHGFEPQMSISLATERTIVCVITISYDREVPGEDARAASCYDTLNDELLARGYPPYRLALPGMRRVKGHSGYDALTTAIKSTLDPSGILSPGRYGVHPLDGPGRESR